MFYAGARRNDEASQECDRLRRLYPDATETHNLLALILGMIGRSGEAAKELDDLRSEIKSLKKDRGVKGWTAGVAPGILSINALNYAATGRASEARTLIREAEEAKAANEYVSSSALGTLYLAAGATDEGFELLEKAIGERDAGFYMYAVLLIQVMGHDRGLSETVLSDSRFASLLKRVGIRFEA
jgi:predicted Zn-dependent protease